MILAFGRAVQGWLRRGNHTQRCERDIEHCGTNGISAKQLEIKRQGATGLESRGRKILVNSVLGWFPARSKTSVGSIACMSLPKVGASKNSRAELASARSKAGDRQLVPA
jgi:hypothetical protein